MNEQERVLNAETALAGAILVDENCLKRIPEALRETDFLDPTCRAVYIAARHLQKEHKRMDPVVLMNWCQEHRLPLDRHQVVALMNATPTAEGAADYANMVHESALNRAVTEAMTSLNADEKAPISQRIDRAMTQLRNISTHVQSKQEMCFADVAYEPPRWLIEPYFQRGKGTLIQADPGTGKTAFMCAVAAAVSTGQGFLGLRVQTPGNVLMISTEDDPGVLRGRIEACGGDLRRVFFLNEAAGLTLDSPEIRSVVRRRQVKLLIFDPFQAFLGSHVDMFRANETRPVLARLFEMCQELDCACVIIAHLGKALQGKSAVNQSIGSVDIPGAMRSILHIVRNPENEEELLAVHIKSSNAKEGKTIAYSIGEKGGVTFHGFSDLKLGDLYRMKREEPFRYEQEPMAEVLCRLLEERGEGFLSYEEVADRARQLLGFVPYKSSKELLVRLQRPDFQRELMQREGIVLETPAKGHNKRGIRLNRYRQPEGYQMRMEAGTKNTNNTKNTMCTVQDDRTHPDADVTLPWEE